MLRMSGDGNPEAQNRNRYAVLRVYARAGETVQLGSSAMLAAGSDDNILVYPPGTGFASPTDPSVPARLPIDPVFATDIFDCNSNDPGTGQIATRAQEVAGPAPNPGGWTPCEFTAPADGVYPIVIMPPNSASNSAPSSSSVANPAVGGNFPSISMWDVTVRDSGGTVQPGRLFSHRLTLIEPTFAGTPPDIAGYLYTPTGYLYRVRLFDTRGQNWELAGNDRGVVDATTRLRTFASFRWGDGPDNVIENFEATAPHIGSPDLASDDRFPIFLRPPDPVAIAGSGGLAATRGDAAAPISPSGALSGLAFTGEDGQQGATAPGLGGTIGFDSPPQMAGLGYTVEIDTDGNGAFGDGTDFVDSTSTLAASGNNTYTWDGQTGDGATPECASFAYRVRSTLAEAHLTLSDVENSGGTQIERLSLPGDPSLGDPFALSYNDIDPYKAVAVTNAGPVAVTNGTSGPGFHAWTADSGDYDFVDTWMRLPEVASTGSFEVRCASDQPQPPTGGPQTVTPPPGAGGEGPAPRSPRPRLRVSKTVDRLRVRAGGTVTFTIKVRNPSGRALRNVRVCDTLPAGLVAVHATPSPRASGGRQCWTIRRLRAGASRTLRLTVRALPGTSGRKVSRAAASAPNARAGRATRAIRVLARQAPAGGVTG